MEPFFEPYLYRILRGYGYCWGIAACVPRRIPKKKNLDTGGAKISKTTSFFCYNETHAGGEKNRNEKEDEELIVKGGLTFTCD